MGHIPYEEWTDLLGDWYLRNDPGEPFMLYADATVLGEIAGLPPPDARADLVAAVHSKGGGREGREFLRPVRADVLKWIYASERASGYPPYLPSIVLSTVVAAEMTDTNYYEPFRRTLELKPYDGGMPRGFDERITTWWDDIIQWLNGDDVNQLDGKLGFLVSYPNNNWPYVGHPRAQAVWKKSDALKLLPAVRRIRPLGEVSDSKILAAVRDYARRNQSRLSARALRTVFDDEYSTVVAASIKQFDSGEAERSRRARKLRLNRAADATKARLWVHRNPRTRRHHLRLVATRPPNWPAELELSTPFGEAARAEVSQEEPRLYRLDTELGPRELELGTVLEGARQQVRFVEQESYILRPDPQGGWRQDNGILPGEPFGLLVAEAASEPIRRWAAEASNVGAPVVDEAFGDWQLFVGLMADDVESAPATVKESLVDARREPLELVGGLRASRSPRTYLTGEAPDARGKGVRRDQQEAVARVNGIDTRVPVREGRLALNAVLVGAGTFEVKHQEALADLRLTEQGDGLLGTGPGWPEPTLAGHRTYIRRTKYGRATYCLLGPPGFFEDVAEPSPAWLSQLLDEELRLPFEVRTSFEPLWCAALGTPGTIKQIQSSQEPHSHAGSGGPVERVSADTRALSQWAGKVLALDRECQVPQEQKEAWQEYVATARKVQST